MSGFGCTQPPAPGAAAPRMAEFYENTVRRGEQGERGEQGAEAARCYRGRSAAHAPIARGQLARLHPGSAPQQGREVTPGHQASAARALWVVLHGQWPLHSQVLPAGRPQRAGEIGDVEGANALAPRGENLGKIPRERGSPAHRGIMHKPVKVSYSLHVFVTNVKWHREPL